MIAIFTLISVLALSLVVIRIATISLVHTGLSRDSAHFQARSAFTGVGFTTSESESIVNHPLRRRIMMTLMLFGNAGIMTAMSSLILTFLTIGDSSISAAKLLLLLGSGLLGVWLVSTSRWLDRFLSRVVAWGLGRFTELEVQDFETLLQLDGDYRVNEWLVEADGWLAGKALQETRLRSEGLNLLGILRSDGEYEGLPSGETIIRAGDKLIMYGRVSGLEKLDQRRRGRRGDIEHNRAVKRNLAEHENMLDAEEST